MNVIEYVEQYPDDDAYDIAKRLVIDEPEMAVPLVAERVNNIRRDRVRIIEHETIRLMLRRKPPVKGSSLAAAALIRAAFLDERIAINQQGQYVTWGEATVDDLRSRKAMLREQITGLRDNVKTLDQAIARIEKAGVSCLNDIADEFAEDEEE